MKSHDGFPNFAISWMIKTIPRAFVYVPAIDLLN